LFVEGIWIRDSVDLLGKPEYFSLKLKLSKCINDVLNIERRFLIALLFYVAGVSSGS
jgi:hypothetical protein